MTLSWARPESGFTLLFEALLLTFASAMAVKKIAKFTGEHDTKIWRVLGHYVSTVRAGLDFSEVERVGVGETAAARGQDYVIVTWNQTATMIMDAVMRVVNLLAAAWSTDHAGGRRAPPPTGRSAFGAYLVLQRSHG